MRKFAGGTARVPVSSIRPVYRESLARWDLLAACPSPCAWARVHRWKIDVVSISWLVWPKFYSSPHPQANHFSLFLEPSSQNRRDSCLVPRTIVGILLSVTSSKDDPFNG